MNSAILRYVGAAVADPATPQTTSLLALNETQLHPLADPAAPGPAVSAENSNGTVIPLSFDIALSGGAFTVNTFSFVPPSVPVLLQILSGTTAAQSLLPTGSVYSLPLNSVIEINIPGGAPGAPVSHGSWICIERH